MKKKDYDHFFKMVLLGDSCVGKSALLVRFADDEFSGNYVSTIGVDFRFRSLRHNGKKIKLQIWDTAGQERYKTITNAYYKGANGIVLVFDLFEKETFNNLDNWIKEVDKHAQADIPIIVIANKYDIIEDTLMMSKDTFNSIEKDNIGTPSDPTKEDGLDNSHDGEPRDYD
jgi:small GTP-binding protein